MRIYLATFSLKIQDRRRNEQLINRFNGQDDFLAFLESFLTSTFQTRFTLPGRDGVDAIYLSLVSMPIIDRERREVYGWFKSGVSGEDFEIGNRGDNEVLFNVNRQHVASRKLFFYFKLPTHGNRVGVVLEKKAKFGIKTIVDKAINSFMQGRGYQDYKIVLDNALPGRFYQQYMAFGRLTKLSIVKRSIPAKLEDLYTNDQNPEEARGTMTTEMTSKAGLPDAYKRFIDANYRNPDNNMVEVEGVDEFGEIEFEISLHGKSKRFYLAKQDKAQPDVDVTADLEIVDGAPTDLSMVQQARELVENIVNIAARNV